MAGVVVPSLTVTSRMAVHLAGVELELVPAPAQIAAGGKLEEAERGEI